MKRLLPFAVLLIAVSVLALGRTTSTQPAQGGGEQAVAARVQEFRDALRKADEAALNSIYADDYTITTADGTVQTKAERIAWVKANAARMGTLDFQDLKTRVYGDTAVVTGRAGGGVNSRFIQVWVRQGGVWRLVAGQVTDVATAQPAEKKP
jgi:ketosteroid isomerase-like protein